MINMTDLDLLPWQVGFLSTLGFLMIAAFFGSFIFAFAFSMTDDRLVEKRMLRIGRILLAYFFVGLCTVLVAYIAFVSNAKVGLTFSIFTTALAVTWLVSFVNLFRRAFDAKMRTFYFWFVTWNSSFISGVILMTKYL